MLRGGVTFELSRQWDRGLEIDAICPVTRDDFESVVGADLGLSLRGLLSLARVERSLVGGSGSVHLCKRLRPDMVHHVLLLQCNIDLSPEGSGVLAYPGLIDEEFRKALFPFFWRAGISTADLDAFDVGIRDWLLVLPEVFLPWLTGELFFEVVKHKGVSAGGLDGWVWREMINSSNR